MSDSITTNVALLRDFQISATTEGVVFYSAEYLQRLISILKCDENNPAEFAEIFPDEEIKAHRDHGKPLPGGRSEKYWQKCGEWTGEKILNRQRYYIKKKLLPSARRKTLEMLSGNGYHQIAAEIPSGTKELLCNLCTWLKDRQPKQQK